MKKKKPGRRIKQRYLTSENFWKKNFVLENKTETNTHWDTSVYANRKLHALLRKYLPKGKKYKILEVGCYPGSKLVFFSKEFGYSVYGVELVKKACTKTKSNLKKFRVNGKIINSDFFSRKFLKKYRSKFDVIFDFGFSEHFKDFDEVVKNYSNLLKNKGYVVIIIPNFRGIYRFFSSKELLDVHNLDTMNSEAMSSIADRRFKTLFSGYVGGMYSDCAKESNMSIFVKNRFIRNTALFLFKLLNTAMDYLPAPESSAFSPYVVYIGKKK